MFAVVVIIIIILIIIIISKLARIRIIETTQKTRIRHCGHTFNEIRIINY